MGYNYRMTDIQAAIGLEQMKKLPWIVSRRRRLAERYTEAFRRHPWLMPPVRPALRRAQLPELRRAPAAPEAGDRNASCSACWTAASPTRRGVMLAHREPPYAGVARRTALPSRKRPATAPCILPLYPSLTEAEQDQVIAAPFAVTGRVASKHHGDRWMSDLSPAVRPTAGRGIVAGAGAGPVVAAAAPSRLPGRSSVFSTTTPDSGDPRWPVFRSREDWHPRAIVRAGTRASSGRRQLVRIELARRLAAGALFRRVIDPGARCCPARSRRRGFYGPRRWSIRGRRRGSCGDQQAAVVEHDCVVGEGASVSPGVRMAGGVRIGAAGLPGGWALPWRARVHIGAAGHRRSGRRRDARRSARYPRLGCARPGGGSGRPAKLGEVVLMSGRTGGVSPLCRG